MSKKITFVALFYINLLQKNSAQQKCVSGFVWDRFSGWSVVWPPAI